MSKLDPAKLGITADLIEAALQIHEGPWQPTLYDLPSAPSASTQGTMSVTDDVELDKQKKKKLKQKDENMDALAIAYPGYNKTITTR